MFVRKVSVCYKNKYQSFYLHEILQNSQIWCLYRPQKSSDGQAPFPALSSLTAFESMNATNDAIINAYIPVSLVVYNWFPREYSLLWAPPASCTTISLSSESDVVGNFPDNVNVWQLICLTFVPIKSLSNTKKEKAKSKVTSAGLSSVNHHKN